MIDTIVLTIPKDKYILLDHDKFSPTTKGLFEIPYYRLGSRSNFKCTQNPTKQELLKGIYKPRLTVTKRIRKECFDIPLKIEFSIPKLIYGNNFDEVTENHFSEIIATLKNKLKTMEILILEKDIINADVSAIHYSKNIALTDYSTSSMIINELQKCSIKRLDSDKTSYRNNGQSIKFHCNSFEVAIYDKIKELEQAKISEKRSIENENIMQLNLLNELKEIKPFEVLRIEIRLNSRAKIRQISKELNYETDLTFKTLFNIEFSKNIINYFWNILLRDIPINLIGNKSNFNLLETLIRNNPKIKYSKALKLLSVIILSQETGLPALRKLLKLNGNKNRYWYKLLEEIKKLNLPETKKYNPVLEASKMISNFEPLSLKYYQLEH
jgi:hypothetical protein